MSGPGNLEVLVPFQIIRKEADADFQRDKLSGKGELIYFRLGQESVRGLQITFHNGLEHGHAHADFAQVFLIFFRWRSDGAHHVPEVVQDEAGHNRIQINDADGVVRVFVQHDVVDLGVVVGDAGGQYAFCLEVQETVYVLLPRPDEFQLCPPLP